MSRSCLFISIIGYFKWTRQWLKKRACFFLMNHASKNRNTCRKRWWDLWCRENGSLLLKWKGCWPSVALQRQNDTTDRWPGLPPSRGCCRWGPLAVPSAWKCSSPLSFRKFEDGWCEPKAFPETIRTSFFSALQGSLVLLCEARLSSVCSLRSVFWPWCRCKESIDPVAPPCRVARIRTRVVWRGWRNGVAATCPAASARPFSKIRFFGRPFVWRSTSSEPTWCFSPALECVLVFLTGIRGSHHVKGIASPPLIASEGKVIFFNCWWNRELKLNTQKKIDSCWFYYPSLP